MTRLFGTNGIRGVVNQDMNTGLACNVGMAIGTYLQGGRVFIAQDTRTSSEMLRNALVSGLLSTGSHVVDIGVAPTPTLQYAVKKFRGNFGVIITASHNPPQFNGIKCADFDGTDLPRNKEEEIEKIYFAKDFKKVTWDKIGTVETEKRTIDTYIHDLCIQTDTSLIKNANLKIVLDCANGAGSLVSPYILERIGCKVITLNAHPQGSFPGHPSEPLPEHLTELINATINFKADIGIAHDGDADRTIFIDEKGNYIYGDKSLALVAKHMVIENKGGLVVTPISSSNCVEEVVLAAGGKIEYTKIGSPVIAKRMIETHAIFGGEENGGLIFPKHQYCRDGAMAAVKIIEIVAKQKKPLSKLIAELPRYSLYKTKIPCPEYKKEGALKKFVEKMKDRKVNTIDGAKVFYKEGWVLVRPSGTEPIYRIFAEAKEPKTAQKLAEENKKIIEGIISSL